MLQRVSFRASRTDGHSIGQLSIGHARLYWTVNLKNILALDSSDCRSILNQRIKKPADTIKRVPAEE